jgi:hypothetical protein
MFYYPTSPSEIPADLWEYLKKYGAIELPYLPSVKDRKDLLEAANNNPTKRKRVEIWDFFFPIDPNQLGARIIQPLIKKFSNKSPLVWGIIFSLLTVLFLYLGSEQPESIYYYLAFFTTLFAVIDFIQQAGRGAKVSKLKNILETIKSQIPKQPSIYQVAEWFQQDVAELTASAQERTAMSNRLIQLQDVSNPMAILGPGFLQGTRIPNIYISALNESKPESDALDRSKHLLAYRYGRTRNSQFIDLYGVFYVEFILVAEDMLGSFGIFFDFISGRPFSERTSEQYYTDVVSLSTFKDIRELTLLGGVKKVIDDAPGFKMSLKSGEIREVTFPSASFFKAMNFQGFDPDNWYRNPQKVADNAVFALRARLRQHKGTPDSYQS